MKDNTKQIDIEVIKSILERKGMTMQDLANKMGKERSVVYKTITNGNPTLSFVISLSKVLEVPLEEIVSASFQSHNMNELERIDGFIEINGKVIRIRSIEDILSIINAIKS